ncbi:hypothetical protein GCM10010254_19280 [Streptomyces chromofuscus]|nr:hypothetical protein GCM10010254_19280 [Streptomyces chromofuscus]
MKGLDPGRLAATRRQVPALSSVVVSMKDTVERCRGSSSTLSARLVRPVRAHVRRAGALVPAGTEASPCAGRLPRPSWVDRLGARSTGVRGPGAEGDVRFPSPAGGPA